MTIATRPTWGNGEVRSPNIFLMGEMLCQDKMTFHTAQRALISCSSAVQESKAKATSCVNPFAPKIDQFQSSGCSLTKTLTSQSMKNVAYYTNFGRVLGAQRQLIKITPSRVQFHSTRSRAAGRNFRLLQLDKPVRILL